MIMTDKFSIRRMGCLMTKFLKDNKKSLILKFLAMYGTLIVVTLFAGWNTLYSYRNPSLTHDVTWINMFPVLAMLTVTFGCLTASVMFEDLRSKESRTSLLMTPATMLEKFLSRWIMFIVTFPILFILGFYIADAVRCLVFHLLVPESTSIAIFDLNEYLATVHLPKEINPIILFGMLFLVIQSFFVLGSTVWQPLSFVKTFGTVFILFIIYILSAIWLTDALIDPNLSYELPKKADNMQLVANGMYCIMMIICLINWTLAYFRLKEAEIIKRW